MKKKTKIAIVVGGAIVGLIYLAKRGQADPNRQVGFGLDVDLSDPNTIYFATDSYSLTDQAKAKLEAFTGLLASSSEAYVNVIGHTDNSGTAQHNSTLSRQRAEAVASYLAGLGVPNDLLIVQYAGETEPVADNSTPEGRQLNRRVELELVA